MRIKNNTLHSYIHSGVFQTLNKSKKNKRSKRSRSKSRRRKRFRTY
jgi:hypothetical protein